MRPANFVRFPNIVTGQGLAYGRTDRQTVNRSTYVKLVITTGDDCGRPRGSRKRKRMMSKSIEQRFFEPIQIYIII